MNTSLRKLILIPVIILSFGFAGHVFAASYTFLTHASVPSENNTGFTTSSVTAPANSLLIVGASYNTEGSAAGTLTPSASGLTFTEVDHFQNDSSISAYLWYAVVGGGGFTGTVTVAPNIFGYSFTGIVGYFDTPDTSSPLVQSTKNSFTHPDNGSPWSITNNYTSGTTNGNLSFAYWDYGQSAGTVPASTARSGWTEIDAVAANFNGGHGSEFQASFTSDTAAGITWASSLQGDTLHSRVIQAEFAAAPSASPTRPRLTLLSGVISLLHGILIIK